MSWTNNFTIRTKVIAAFAFVLLVTAVLGVFAVTRLSKVDDGAEDVTSNWLVATRALGDFSTAAVRFRQVEASVALAPNEEAMQHEDEHLTQDVLPEVKAALAQYEPTITPGEERERYTLVMAKWNAYFAMTDDYMNLARSDRAKAGALYIGAMKMTFNDFQGELKALIKFQLDGANAERDSIRATYSLAWDMIAGLLALAALMCVAAGYFLVSSVSRPIKAMTDAMGRLARHDLSTVIDGIGRKDEVGQMASAVQVFKDSMIEGDRLKAEQEAAQRKQQERSARLDQITKAFETSVGSVVQTVASQATQMEGSAQSMSATAEETTKQAAAVAAASEQSSANVQTVASATEELSSSISEIGRQVTHSSHITASAVAEANRANEMVQGLVSASSKIGEIVALINDIADQTNLLALNATIEAARAGEAGKGFAVVAAEVKNLATQTAKATDDIRVQITGVQSATQDAVKAIETIGKTIGEVNQIATTIAVAVEEQGAATKEIARNVEEAAKGTQEVSSNIGGVTQAANDTGSVAGQVLGAARSLTGQSGHLKDLVQTFLADVKAA
ncbi:MAG: MCP four helix bundle domain-containing protein [Alphaproteobacteria bacterium]|nr:MCP four helix bundle domain-containing protein [Alphaproteobacteria bacterium]MBL6936520.1 MCP four helix bundle domain-containing protein [Alphaproteobacteria bacterium]MBL7098429.1 MCP four helix bundle domain-containing protein [Alphaproteobacteria bacterium]